MLSRFAAVAGSASTVALYRSDDALRKAAVKAFDFDVETDVPTDSDESSHGDMGCRTAVARSTSSFSSSLEDSPTKTGSRMSTYGPLWLITDSRGCVQVVESAVKPTRPTPQRANVLNLASCLSPAIRPPPGLWLPTSPQPGLSLPTPAASESRDTSPSECSYAACAEASTIAWTVDARKLDSDNKVIVSPSFDVDVAGQTVPFKVILTPKETVVKKGGPSFKRSKGHGTIQLKCESAGAFAKPVEIKFAVGRSGLKGPVVHDFDNAGVCTLKRQKAHWNFSQAVDAPSQTFDIRIEILCTGV
eukprot:TRINITY_DN5829_c0_g1_i1.p1 TRINITY_DN5829_c0_g1~~TRINITY_DN5829_c0_g1_i1.p1  ORF type:complete len:303 (-),score=45.61 TRINITY_DN5829_c0_g1_i1:261-1169(-)